MLKQLQIKKIKYLIVASWFAMLWLVSCNSPMDVDTPRIETNLSKALVRPALVQIISEENGNPKFYTAGEAFCTVDTCSNKQKIWLKLSLEQTATTLNYENKLSIIGLDIVLDSLIMKPEPTIINNPNKSWMRFKLRRAEDAKYDTTVYSGSARNQSEVSFNFNKETEEIWAFIYSKIYSDKYVKELVDSSYTDKNGNQQIIKVEKIKIVQDSLMFRTSLKFIY